MDEELEKTASSDNPATVTIRLSNGTTYEKTVYAGKGSILNPMSREEVCQKFRGFVTMASPDFDKEAIIETVEALDSVENIRELTQMLTAA